MAKWKDDAEYGAAWGKARDGMNMFPPNSNYAGQYGAGFGHVFRNVNSTRGGRDGGPEPVLATPRPVVAVPHAEGEAVKPQRTPAWQRGLVHGMMWRRKNPRFY